MKKYTKEEIKNLIEEQEECIANYDPSAALDDFEWGFYEDGYKVTTHEVIDDKGNTRIVKEEIVKNDKYAKE